MLEIAVLAPLTKMERRDEFEFASVPLHVTVLPNWTISLDVGQAGVIMQRIAETFATFDVRTAAIDWFGPQDDIEVATLEPSAQLTRLHQLLVDGVAHHGTAVNPEYNDGGYRPHSTMQSDARLDIGESRTIDRLAVVDCTRRVRIITDVFPLNR